MANYKNDARYRELQLLLQFERERWVTKQYPSNGSTHDIARDKQMVLSLVIREMVNGPDTRSTPYDRPEVMGRNLHEFVNNIEAQSRITKIQTLHALLAGNAVDLEMGHLGRLRLHELEDELKATRLRDSFGILFDGRYVERDLAIAIMDSSTEEPVSLAYLDMNGLKSFNEDGDHATGDAAIKAFFHTIEKAVSGAGDAYRKGGDEVVIVMPATPIKEAQKYIHAALVSLAKEKISVHGEYRSLSSSCGLVAVSSHTANAENEIHRADLVQKKAKEASKRSDRGRCSVLFVQDETGKNEEVIVL